MVVTWAKIALYTLQIAQFIMSYLEKQNYRNEGYEKAVAEMNAKMLRNNQYAKQELQNIGLLSDDAVDERLRGLEPP